MTTLDSFDREFLSEWEKETAPDYAVTEQSSNTPNPRIGIILPSSPNSEVQSRLNQAIQSVFIHAEAYTRFKQNTPTNLASARVQMQIQLRKAEKQETAKVIKQKLNDLINQAESSDQVHSLLSDKGQLATYCNVDLDDFPDDDSYLPDNLQKQKEAERKKKDQQRQQQYYAAQSADRDWYYLEKDFIDLETGHNSKLTPLPNGNALYSDINCKDPEHITKIKQEVQINPNGQPKLLAQTPQTPAHHLTQSEVNAICQYGKARGWEEPEHIPPKQEIQGSRIAYDPTNGLTYGEILGMHDAFLQQERDIRQARQDLAAARQPHKTTDRRISDPFHQFDSNP